LDILIGNNTMNTKICLPLEAAPEVASVKYRIASIERLRIISIYAVVSFHTHAWFPHSLCFVGLIILLLCSCAFVVNKPETYGLGDLAKRKAERLLVPWLFWSVVYGGLGLAKMIIKNVSFSDVFSAKMLLTGTRIHLWFLPFVFVAAIFLGFVHRRIVRLTERFVIIPGILIGALAVLACSMIQSYVMLWTPLVQWALGLPAIPLGFALGRTMLVQDSRHRRDFYLLATLSTATVAVASVVFAWLDHGAYLKFGIIYATRYFVAVAIVCSGLYWQGHLDTISRKLASLSYGIYLIHPLILIPFYQFGIGIQHPLVLLFVVLFISSLVTFILKKTSFRRFV